MCMHYCKLIRTVSRLITVLVDVDHCADSRCEPVHWLDLLCCALARKDASWLD